MNGKQKAVVLVGTAVLLGMLLYPPWGIGTEGFFVGSYFEPPHYYSHGYAPVYAPPHPNVTINTFRLFFQCAVTVLVTFALFVVFAHRSKD